MITSFYKLTLYLITLATISGCSSREMPVLYALPKFEFTTSLGNPFGHSEFKNKVTVVDFIFTSCQGVCPEMTASMGGLKRKFETESRVQFVSITVDPAQDSLQVLQKYAKDVGIIDHRWKFLWAPIDDVVKLSHHGFKLAADNLPEGHSSRFVLVDRSANIRGYYDSLDGVEMDKLSVGIYQLLKSY